MSRADGDPPYWSQDPSALAAALESGPGGLSSDRAAAQLALVGPNSFEDAPRLSALRLLLRQFESPLVLILAFAAAISLVLQQWVDAAIILAIVLGSSLLGFFQEYRASMAVEELKKRLALMCRVVRDGVEQTVPVSTIVPGDLILLSAGNLIPADGLVIEAEDFLVSEASMTGESFPVEKRPGMIPRTHRSRPGPTPSFSAPRYAAAPRRFSPSGPGARPSSGRSRDGSGRARPRPTSRAACGSSAICSSA